MSIEQISQQIPTVILRTPDEEAYPLDLELDQLVWNGEGELAAIKGLKNLPGGLEFSPPQWGRVDRKLELFEPDNKNVEVINPEGSYLNDGLITIYSN